MTKKEYRIASKVSNKCPAKIYFTKGVVDLLVIVVQ